MMKICTVLVTYNRKELLKQAIDALKKQTYCIEKIVIINNNSTDGTKEYLNAINDNEMEIINLNDNIGGAGGFYTGIKHVALEEYDYLWLMDDDTIVEPNALENLIYGIKLIENRNKSIGFVCSNVLYKDGTPCLMNIPATSKKWNSMLSEGIVEVESASFVSLLINNNAIKEVGLPIKEFFIWGDDVEYTRRLSRAYGGYIIGNSKVKHYMNSNQETNILVDNERINRYFYDFRNSIYIARQGSSKDVAKIIIGKLYLFIKIIFKKNKYKLKKIITLFKGLICGIFFNPKIEYIEDK